MMLNLNIRDIKIENKKNNSHTKHGRVALPGIRVGVNGIVSACYDITMIIFTIHRGNRFREFLPYATVPSYLRLVISSLIFIAQIY
ncbi:MAG: hypothetical protein ABS938_05565 [Psychrobacillus psychrodurans]